MRYLVIQEPVAADMDLMHQDRATSEISPLHCNVMFAGTHRVTIAEPPPSGGLGLFESVVSGI